LHVRLIAPVVTTTSIILSSNKIQNGDVLVLLTQIRLEEEEEEFIFRTKTKHKDE